ncbi:MAG: recombinase family protein [Clostridia bacterium]|nr:recombinase family protein [Clostridia bacterium]
MKSIGQRKTIAACYCRLSDDDDQDGTSVSIETQTKILGDYCRDHGMEVFGFYKDDGYTGTNFNRPAFKQMMKDIDEGFVNTVVVKDLSRFGREHLQVGNYLQMVFPNKKVRFIAIGDDVDSDRGSLDYDLMIPIKNIFNEYYPADCSRKTRQAFISKASNGEFIGAQAPYGYRKSQADKHVLELDDKTAWVITWMFEMAAYHGYGYNKIARVLTERKVITPAAYQAERAGRSYAKDPYEWNLATVSKILANETYLGHLVSGKRRIASFKNKRVIKQPEDKWIIVENQFPPLISSKLWNDAHEKLKTRKRESSSGFVNIFAGLIKCADCGYALGITNAKTQSNYFICQTYSKKGKAYCTSHYITYNALYRVVLADLREMLRTVKENREEFKKQILQKISSDNDSGRKLMDKEIADLTKRVEELSVKYDRLYEDHLDGLLSEKKFREMAERCEAEQSKAEERLAEMKAALDNTDQTEQEVEDFIMVAEHFEEIEELDKEILNRLVSSITVGQKTLDDMGERQEIRVNYRFLGRNPA